MHSLLGSLFSDMQVSRQLMFDVTEIPHCLEDLDTTFFAQDMKRLKAAHQYMKGTIPERMYQQIKSQLQKYLTVLLKCHRQLIRIDADQIEDEASFQLYAYMKRYFTSSKQSFSLQFDSFTPSVDEYDILSPETRSEEMVC